MKQGGACFLMGHADMSFLGYVTEHDVNGNSKPEFTLQCTDSWTGRVEKTVFESEMDMLRFCGEYLTNGDGPTPECSSRFPGIMGPQEPKDALTAVSAGGEVIPISPTAAVNS